MKMSRDDLKGKVILITGAACGIGEATAKKFAELGSILALLDVNSEKLKEVVEECHSLGQKFKNPKPYFLVGDVANDDIRKQYVDDTIKNFGRIDVVFNNAGIILPGDLLTAPMSVFDKMFNIHVRAVYDMCRLTAPHLIKTKGCIVNVSSIGAYATSGMSIYCAAKAAIKHLTTTLADELGAHRVRVVAISPGPVKTTILKDIAGADVEKHQNEWGNLTLVGRCALPSEIANWVAFIVSEEGSFMNGTDIILDGGLLARRRK